MNEKESSCCGLGPTEQGSKENSLQRGVSTEKGKSGSCKKNSVEYKCWTAMKDRCLKPNHYAFHRYGGRGIKICDRWMSFENFLSDMGARPLLENKMTLDRINNDGPYSPENCRWATYLEQNRNRSDNVSVTIGGVDYPSISAAAEAIGIKRKTLERRVRKGWAIEQLSRSTKPIRGDEHHASKMTLSKAEQMRTDAILLRGSGKLVSTLMDRYGIKKSLVSMILSRKVWV